MQIQRMSDVVVVPCKDFVQQDCVSIDDFADVPARFDRLLDRALSRRILVVLNKRFQIGYFLFFCSLVFRSK